ncbi:hypothetical protein B0T13DRAFT_7491 [Neurospora crassa]|nr:hypothetical protein B0T13DRAFT_7491 [Neurospora crassa]
MQQEPVLGQGLPIVALALTCASGAVFGRRPPDGAVPAQRAWVSMAWPNKKRTAVVGFDTSPFSLEQQQLDSIDTSSHRHCRHQSRVVYQTPPPNSPTIVEPEPRSTQRRASLTKPSQLTIHNLI